MAAGAQTARGEWLEPRVLFTQFDVTTDADSGPGSLRQAILNANANPGRDSVLLNWIDRPAPALIRLLSPLPEITDPVDLGALPNEVPVTELDGSLAGPDANGLVVGPAATGSGIRHLAINRFGGSGVVARGSVVLETCAIGTDLAGTAALGNGRGPGEGAGVRVGRGGSVQLGRALGPPFSTGPTVIAANHGDGVLVEDGGDAVLVNGRIGTAGDPALANRGNGVTVRAGGRFTVAGPGSFFPSDPELPITGNTGDGVRFEDGARGGLIGALVSRNGGAGVRAGDATLDADNGVGIEDSIISDNGGGGVVLDGTRGVSMFRNVIDHNGSHGVAMVGGATGNKVTGSVRLFPFPPRFSRNEITNNGGSGVYIEGPGTRSNLVDYAWIRGNAGDGVTLVDTSDNLIGGVPLAGNDITGNHRNGIADRAVGPNALSNNTIYGNDRLGIDLLDDGQTPNDPGDADSGPQDLLNYPVFISVRREDGGTRVTGTINTAPNNVVGMAFFTDSPELMAPGSSAQGRNRVGTTSVTTDAEGNASFDVTLGRLSDGSLLTAMASLGPADQAELVSEFSPAVSIGLGLRVVRLSVVSSGWPDEFRSRALPSSGMGNALYGYVVQSRDLIDLRPLPWGGLDTVVTEFSEPPAIGVHDVHLRDSAGEMAPRALRFSGNVITWVLPRPLESGYVDFSIDAEAVNGTGGSSLDGDWRGDFPSGDGTPGGDFAIRLAVLPGDADRDGRVNAVDLGRVRARQLTNWSQRGTPPNTYDVYTDVVPSGGINAVDLGLVRSKQLTALPPPPPSVLSAQAGKRATELLA